MATRSVTYDHVAFLRRVEAALADGTDPATTVGFLGVDVVDTAWQVLEHDLPRLLSALIQHLGLDVNGVIAKSGGWSLLGLASCLGSVRCVAALISLGADVNATFVAGGKTTSAMFGAACEGHVPVMRQLVDAGASFDGHNSEGQLTLLHVAAQRGHIGVVAFLMQRGASTYAADENLQHPISHAVIFSRLLCVKALLPKADLTHADAGGMTLLHQAVSSDAGPEVLEAILPRYVAEGLLDMPTAKAQDSDKLACMTALMMACQQAKLAHVQLLQAGASRHVQDSKGAQPLVHCIAGKSIECLQLVLALDDVQNRYFTPQQLTYPSPHTPSPLVCAVHAGRADMVQLLIAAGADPSGTFQAGVTFHGLARKWWPDNKDLAALFTPGFAPGSAP